MGGTREQGLEDRQDLAPVLDADVHVGAEDEHLVAPQPGAVHQACVALGVGHLLHQRVGEGVGPGRGQVHAQRVGDGKDSVEGEGDVLHALGHGPARPGDQLDGVEHHLAVHVRVRAHLLEDLLGALAQVEAVAVDEGQLPLHPQRGAGRSGEVKGLGAAGRRQLSVGGRGVRARRVSRVLHVLASSGSPVPSRVLTGGLSSRE